MRPQNDERVNSGEGSHSAHIMILNESIPILINVVWNILRAKCRRTKIPHMLIQTLLKDTLLITNMSYQGTQCHKNFGDWITGLVTFGWFDCHCDPKKMKF